MKSAIDSKAALIATVCLFIVGQLRRWEAPRPHTEAFTHLHDLDRLPVLRT